jgi:hypothetical protein
VEQIATPTQRVDEDNIYDATPRQSEFPGQQQQQQQKQQSSPSSPLATQPVVQVQPQQQQQPSQQSPQQRVTVQHEQPQQQPQQQSPQLMQQPVQLMPQPTQLAPVQQEPQQSSPSPPPQQQQEQQPRSDTPNNVTIVINGSVELKSAGSSHEMTRPTPQAHTTPSPSPPAAPNAQSQQLHPQQAYNTDQDHSHSDFDEFDSDMESPIIQDASIATVQQASPSTSPTAQNGGAAAKDNVAIFERAKKKAEEEREAEMRLVWEEKIPVFDEGDQEDAAKKNRDEEAVKAQMSATSYPGQEWNPYGEGGFEEWD